MLQQTQVATVIPYFRRFMRQFPNVKQLAESPLDSVLACWSGLGYYARARHLHQAAQVIRGSGGRLPRTVEDWMHLPGIGRSTAGAIVSLALNQPAPMLDGNARRVIARHQGLPMTSHVALWRAAEQLLPDQDAAAYTQGLMDLGSQCCTPRAPDCTHCPLSRDCHYANHEPDEQSSRKRSPLPRRDFWVAIVQSEDGQVLLQQRSTDSIWGGLWSLPEYPDRSAARRWARDCGKKTGVAGRPSPDPSPEPPGTLPSSPANPDPEFGSREFPEKRALVRSKAIDRRCGNSDHETDTARNCIVNLIGSRLTIILRAQ